MPDGWNVASEAPAQERTPGVMPMITVRPTPARASKLTADDFAKQWAALGYAPGGTAGVTQNVFRESGGDPTQFGDGGTSRGLFQHHAERKTELEKFAADNKGSPDDPAIQIKFADHELQTQYPKLRARLMDPTTTAADAEEAFRRIFERPASNIGPNGPVGNEKFQFSDYAMESPRRQRDTEMVWMRPQDYLDLTPDLGDDPRAGKSYAALKKSLARGDRIEDIPSLEVVAGEGGAKVFDQDGRNRARAAQEAGLDMIPVAVKRSGKGKGPITELEGMNGKLLPYDFQPVQPAQAGKGKEQGLLASIGSALIPSAEAAEMPKSSSDTGWTVASEAPAGEWGVNSEQRPDGMLMSGVKGVAAGFGRTVLGGQELVGKGLDAVGATGAGDWLVNDARKGIANLDTATAADRAAHPWATGAGDLLGSAAIPGGVAGRIGGNALKVGAIAGGLSGLLEPASGDGGNFLAQKALQTGVGAAGGAAVGKAGELALKALSPVTQTIAGWVSRVKGPDVLKEPGAMEILRRMEQDAKGGGPTAQNMLDLLNLTPDKPMTLADVGGPNVRALMGRVARQPGDGQTMLKKFHVERDLDAGLRIDRDINENIGAGSAHTVQKGLEEGRSKAAAPLYESAFAENQQMESPVLDKIIRTPAGQKAIRSAVTKMQNDMTLVGKPDPELTALAKEVADLGLMAPHGSGIGVARGLKLRTWDYVKRSLDDQIGTAQRAGEKDEARILTGLKKGLVNELDNLDVTGRAGPNSTKMEGGDYARARAVYSGHSQSLDALDAGRKFMRKSPEEISAELADMTPGDREFYRVGAAEAERARVGDATVGGDEAKKAITNRNMRLRLRAVVGGEEALAKFEQAIHAESTMFRTDTEAFKNSLTASRQAEDRSAENEAAGRAFHAVLNWHSGNPVGAATNMLRAGRALLERQNPELNTSMAQLFSQPVLGGGGPSPGLKLLQDFGRQAPATQNFLSRGARIAAPLLGPAAQQGSQGVIGQ